MAQTVAPVCNMCEEGEKECVNSLTECLTKSKVDIIPLDFTMG